jgi:D-threonate/D-erythronate kinase
VTDLLVLADDRTGALETAGACAAAGLAAAVAVSVTADVTVSALVVDLATRHLPVTQAAALASAASQASVGRSAHKIDSTLRGAWADELVARHRATGRPVLVVPAFPAMGRVCVDGVVLIDGRPVAEVVRDARGQLASSRPADLLRAAGAGSVVDVRDAGEVSFENAPFVVCDAVSDADLAAAASLWQRNPAWVLAGTAATIGAGAAALADGSGRAAATPLIRAPVLVVCGSLHDRARAQVTRLVDDGFASAEQAGVAVALLREGRSVVVSSPRPDHLPVTAAEAASAVDRLARLTVTVLASKVCRTLVVVGGDTAAAVLGDAPRAVGGLVAAGVPWCPPTDDDPLVLAKPGGFGDEGLLVALLSARMQP